MKERWRDRQVGKEGGRERDQHRESSGKEMGELNNKAGKKKSFRTVCYFGWEDRDSGDFNGNLKLKSSNR